jgi:hypothetical protein
MTKQLKNYKSIFNFLSSFCFTELRKLLSNISDERMPEINEKEKSSDSRLFKTNMP